MTELPNFDKLLWLAKNNPHQLDELQQKCNQEAIAQSCKANRASLTSLLDHLNKRLALCKTPYQRCEVTSLLMFEKLAVLNQVYSQPTAFFQHKAQVMPMRKSTQKKQST